MPVSTSLSNITFLFTDIEGSTKLWEQHPDSMRLALARHDAILRQSIEENQGIVFKTIGDAFCAAFTVAHDALNAALALQKNLADEPWGLPTPLRVRVALHTGQAEERGGDYFGPPLNRVARLLAAGHGGQTLLSLATQELVQEQLSADTALLDLGQRRLKDLAHAEQVFQLVHPALPSHFPPLRSLDNPDLPNNLPQQISSLIERETEVADVKVLLSKTRLLTLTGTGGSGKSRLSLQAAADLLDQYFEGVWLVELAPLSDPTLVPQAVADVFGVREATGKTLRQSLTEWLKPKRLLLVLDNCEHLLDACAALAADLLKSCPSVHILTSSREPLNVAGELTYRVPSLSLPDPKQVQTVESLSQYGAVRLLIERAQAVRPEFSVTIQNAPAVAQVCQRLDGIPLAIELAAARVRSLSVEEVNTRLDRRFRLLTGGARTLLPRQQTLRALIDWSYDLLTDQERTLLRRLSVFAGGWTLSAAEAIGAGTEIEAWEVVDLLTGLVDKSLVVYEAEASGGERFRLLETIRQYAHDRLEESGEAAEVQHRAASWFLALAEQAEPQLTGPEQAAWLARLETEHDNLRTSLAWYERGAEDVEGSLRLAGALWRFWFIHGDYTEGRQWLDRALARAKEPATEARAKALNGAGNLADEQGDYAGARALYAESLTLRRQWGDQQSAAGLLSNLGSVAAKQGEYAAARALYEEGLTVFRQLGNQNGIAGLLNNLGLVANMQGDSEAARAVYTESLALCRQLGNQQGIAAALNNLGNVVFEQGDYEAARAAHTESLALQRQLGNQRGIANSLSNLGTVATGQGKDAMAQTLHEESLAIRRQLGDQRGIANSLGSLGTAASRQGNFAGARVLHAESLSIFRRLGDQGGIAESIEGIAGMAQEQSQPARAVRLWGAGASLRESIGHPRPPVEQEQIDRMTTSAREALGEDAFTAAWDAGRAMTWEQAVEYALSNVSSETGR